MCVDCGCHTSEEHSHPKRRISLEGDLLAANDRLAAENRAGFESGDIFTLNLLSSPGSGKTSILERTVAELTISVAVIEGDQQTGNDAARIEAAGARAVQVNTGSGCHLDARMVSGAADELGLESGSILFIENVGNLVCPALFDLGEAVRVVIVSVTEGEDKPEKYPYIFRNADLCLINKIDLLPYLDFDLEALKKSALSVNPDLFFIELSARDGRGFPSWLSWLEERKKVASGRRATA